MCWVLKRRRGCRLYFKMKFKIQDGIFDAFPELQIGIVVAKGINNTRENAEIVALLRDQEKEIRTKFTPETLSEEPRIEAWRKAYSSFGAKPKKYRCSVENLYRMILQGTDLRHINTIVDIYNYISIKHIIPVGGDDLDHVEGDIALTVAKGDESFKELNSDVVKNPDQGEVVYVDDKEVLCRRWNWRECDKSKMTKGTKNITLVVEGLPPVTYDEITIILGELADLIKSHLGGTVKTFIVNKARREIEF